MRAGGVVPEAVAAMRAAVGRVRLPNGAGTAESPFTPLLFCWEWSWDRKKHRAYVGKCMFQCGLASGTAGNMGCIRSIFALSPAAVERPRLFVVRCDAVCVYSSPRLRCRLGAACRCTYHETQPLLLAQPCGVPPVLSRIQDPEASVGCSRPGKIQDCE